MKLLFETTIGKNYLRIKEGFNKELFLYLKPPGVSVDLERFDGCSPGDEVHLGLNTLGFKQKWISLITEETQDENEWSFVDEGKSLPWPLVKWKHHHKVIALNEGSSKIIDDISYSCASGVMEKLIYPALWSSFAVRPAKYKKFFKDKT